MSQWSSEVNVAAPCGAKTGSTSKIPRFSVLPGSVICALSDTEKPTEGEETRREEITQCREFSSTRGDQDEAWRWMETVEEYGRYVIFYSLLELLPANSYELQLDQTVRMEAEEQEQQTRNKKKKKKDETSHGPVDPSHQASKEAYWPTTFCSCIV